MARQRGVTVGVAAGLLAAAWCGAGAEEPALLARSGVLPLRSPAGPGSGEPNLAVAPDGAVWMSWLERRPGGGHALRIARLAGNRWSRPRAVAAGDSFFVNWADFPSVLPLERGRLIAHWPWKSGSDTYAYDVRISQSGDGGATWSPPLVPHRDGTATEHGFVSLVPDAGGVRAVWLDGRDFANRPSGHGGEGGHGGAEAEMALRTAVILPDGSLSDEAVLDGRVCDCCQTAAVRTRRGVLVAYRDRSADEIRDISLVRVEGGRATDPYPLARDGWNIPGCPVNGPALAASGDRVAAAWFTAAGDSARVLAAFSADGGATFGPPRRVDEGAPLGRVDVKLLDDGTALVLWLEGGPQATVRLRRMGDGGGHGPAVVVTRTSQARASGFPRMARSGDRLVLAWTDAARPARVRTAAARLRPAAAVPR